MGHKRKAQMQYSHYKERGGISGRILWKLSLLILMVTTPSKTKPTALICALYITLQVTKYSALQFNIHEIIA